MRDYSKIAPSFWTGRTGKALRGDMAAQIVALYLMTCPHATMIGVFHCPIVYVAHETGLSPEGASKALARLCEGGFCTFDETLDLVWVHEMARYQVGESLKANDNRVSGINADYQKIPQGIVRKGFYERYRTAFHLPEETFPPSPSEAPYQAPPKPLRSQEQEQKKEQEQKEENLPSSLRSDGSAAGEVSADPNASAEDLFWSKAPAMDVIGIRRSQLGELAKLLNGDFDRALTILDDAAGAKKPPTYFGAIVRNLRAELGGGAVVPINAADRSAPAWVLNLRNQGEAVTKDGERWRWAGTLYDDDQRVVGW